jgi:hypothetical protein
MRFAPVAAILLFYVAHPSSNGQTPFPSAGSGDQGAPPPPLVSPRPATAGPSPEANHKQLLADLQALITESQALQHELQSTPSGTVSAQSLKRSQKIESLAKRIRKTLKLN